MWAYHATAYIPKYVHFQQVTLSYMRKWAVSQCNRQITNMKHLETRARQHSYVMPSEVMTLVQK